MGRGDVNLIHPVHGFDDPRVWAEALGKHLLHRRRVRDVRERVFLLRSQSRVPPVRGATAIRVLLGDEAFDGFHRRPILRARQLSPHHVIMRHDPRQEALVHVHHRVQAQRQQIKRVFDEQRRPIRKLHVRRLIRLLPRRRVRRLLPRVRRREHPHHPPHRHPARAHRPRRARDHRPRHRRRHFHSLARVRRHRRRRVRPKRASRARRAPSRLQHRHRARHRHRRRHQVQRDVERVRVVPSELRRRRRERLHGVFAFAFAFASDRFRAMNVPVASTRARIQRARERSRRGVARSTFARRSLGVRSRVAEWRKTRCDSDRKIAS